MPQAGWSSNPAPTAAAPAGITAARGAPVLQLPAARVLLAEAAQQALDHVVGAAVRSATLDEELAAAGAAAVHQAVEVQQPEQLGLALQLSAQLRHLPINVALPCGHPLPELRAGGGVEARQAGGIQPAAAAARPGS